MILEQIVTDVRQRLEERKKQRLLVDLESLVNRGETPMDFTGALQGTGIKVIAEVKRASPSKGWLCRNLEVAGLVQSYIRGGAAAISVLTESSFFKGSFNDLTTAHRTSNLPVLCKDFILEPYQIYEARSYGADAILLIAAILSASELSELMQVAQRLGMSALIEVHDEKEVERALDAKGNLIGINNRNLDDFSVEIGTTLRLRPLIPPGIIVVSESGIKSHDDILRLKVVGINAVLVGETLVASHDPEAKLKGLRGEGIPNLR
jgi:indole-3-glycerol phosphate synthase